MDNQQHNIILYQIDSTKVCVRYANEAFWLTQKSMTKLFEVKVPNISKHLSNIMKKDREKRQLFPKWK